jgi:hypothetical protein
MGNESRAARGDVAHEAAESVGEAQGETGAARAGRARGRRCAGAAGWPLRLGRYALVIGGARVEFGDDASVTTLRRLLEALR